MKIQLLSDVHLEAHPHFVPQPAPGADVLILAGDIGSYQSGSLLKDSDFGLQRFSPVYGWPTEVVFVPGNHEYDSADFDATHTRLQETCHRLGIQWLERSTIATKWFDRSGQPLRLLGTTLWTDFDALAGDQIAANAHQPQQPSLLSRQLQARQKAIRAANYYLRKAGTCRHGEPFLAEQVREQALQCQQWLAAELALPFAGSTVVVTHFAPSLRSADPRYGLTPGTAGFCNSLDALVQQADLWLHGHLHAPSDYPLGKCRVVANPLGYARKNEQAAFKAASVIEI
jgi:predicted phosphodiesterase